MPLVNPQRPLFMMAFNPAVTTTNIPAAITEYGSNTAHHFKLDMSGYVECRIHVSVFTNAPAGANIRFQYSLDDSTSWTDLTTNASLVATGRVESTWSSIPSGALGGDVYIRIVTDGGNAVDDPITAQVMLKLR